MIEFYKPAIIIGGVIVTFLFLIYSARNEDSLSKSWFRKKMKQVENKPEFLKEKISLLESELRYYRQKNRELRRIAYDLQRRLREANENKSNQNSV